MENNQEIRRIQLLLLDTAQEFLPHIEEELIRRYAEEMTIQIITDPEMAGSFFQEKREIDVLVTDTEDYQSYLQGYSFGHALVLASEVDVESTLPEQVEVLMKYAPSAELFRRMEEALQEKGILEAPPVEEKVHNTRVIGVYSPIGGCGKSLVAYALAKKLRKLDQKVLRVGCDPTQSIAAYFPPDMYAKEELAEKLVAPGEETYWTILQNIEQDDISYLLPFEKNLSTLEIGMPQWELLLTVLTEKQDFDYIVLDVGTNLDRAMAALLAKANFLILLTETNQIANRKMQKLLLDSELLPKCECFMVANEYRADGMRIAPESVFGTLSPYANWEEALDDPVFSQIALRVTE